MPHTILKIYSWLKNLYNNYVLHSYIVYLFLFFEVLSNLIIVY